MVAVGGIFGLRPWRDYQRTFTSSYESYLNKQIAAEKKVEDSVTSSPDYKQLLAAVAAAQATAKPVDEDIQGNLHCWKSSALR